MRLQLYPSAFVCFLFLAHCGDKNDPGYVETADTSVANATSGGSGTTTGTTTDPNATTATTTTGTTTGSSTGSSAASGLCGTSSTAITYDANVGVILNASCTQCHAPGKSKSSTPVNTKASAISTFQNNNGRSQVDTKAMPLSGSLTDNQICIIDNWVSEGYN